MHPDVIGNAFQPTYEMPSATLLVALVCLLTSTRRDRRWFISVASVASATVFAIITAAAHTRIVDENVHLAKARDGFVRRALQDFITQELDKQGYSQVFTPHIGKLDLYRTSGHFPYYQESQFPAIAERDVLEKLADEDATCAPSTISLGTVISQRSRALQSMRSWEMMMSVWRVRGA